MDAAAPERRLVYSIAEAGEILGLSRSAAYAAAKDGTLPVIRIGKKSIRVPKKALDRLLNGTDANPQTPR